MKTTDLFKPVAVLFVAVLLATGCDSDSEIGQGITQGGDEGATGVLMLKVDYTTNTFEGGYEYIFDESVKKMTISSEYKEPGDLGGIKFYLSELDELLFDATIIWLGHGKIQHPAPDKWLSATDFDATETLDYVSPKNGFEELLDYEGFLGYFRHLEEAEIMAVWGAVQPLIKVREYIKKNPDQKVKMYLYTPAVGGVNWTVAKWIIFLEKSKQKPIVEAGQDYSLTGKTWKLTAFVNTETGERKAPEPENCESCYNLTFLSDKTLHCTTSTNMYRGSYDIDSVSKTIQATSNIGGITEINELFDGKLFLERMSSMQSYSIVENQLRLYYDKYNYMEFNPVKL